jgi:hypothetical protein
MVARYLSVVALSFGVIGSVRFIATTSAPPRSSISSPAALSSSTNEFDQERGAALVDQKFRRERYVTLVDRLEKGLLQGTICLREATERLFYYCVENYPEIIDFMVLAETGKNIKTRIARSFLRGFHIAQAERYGGSAMDDIVERLERELGDLPYEQEQAGRLEQR